jgi:hypothetical protein
MATIVLGSYMVRYPLGGMASWVLQYLVGLDRLGHEVWFVEKADGPDACFDPTTGTMGDDASYGVEQISDLLDRVGLRGRLCFVDVADQYHGVCRRTIDGVFEDADLFIDMGTHGAWLTEARGAGQRVLLDGEPGFTQIKLQRRVAAGEPLPCYDRWFTTGRNVGTEGNRVPTLGLQWEHVWHPVATELFAHTRPVPGGAPFTTVMNWRSHAEVELAGVTYGHKDLEFPRFESLPAHTSAPLEIAVAGPAPRRHLEDLGWHVRHGHDVSRSFDDFAAYIEQSAAEFGVCKNAFVALDTGWFSDRSAAYLASGRPVILQDTGFGDHLPTGEGLFAVRTVDESVAAIEAITDDWSRHSEAAAKIAYQFLDASVVLRGFLETLGIGSERQVGVPA